MNTQGLGGPKALEVSTTRFRSPTSGSMIRTAGWSGRTSSRDRRHCR